MNNIPYFFVSSFLICPHFVCAGCTSEEDTCVLVCGAGRGRAEQGLYMFLCCWPVQCCKVVGFYFVTVFRSLYHNCQENKIVCFEGQREICP